MEQRVKWKNKEKEHLQVSQEQPSLPKELAWQEAEDEHAPLCSPQLQLLGGSLHICGFKTCALCHKKRLSRKCYVLCILPQTMGVVEGYRSDYTDNRHPLKGFIYFYFRWTSTCL